MEREFYCMEEREREWVCVCLRECYMYFLTFSPSLINHYLKWNFPYNPSVRPSVGWSDIVSKKGGKLLFHAPIEALVILWVSLDHLVPLIKLFVHIKITVYLRNCLLLFNYLQGVPIIVIFHWKLLEIFCSVRALRGDVKKSGSFGWYVPL